MGTSPQELGAHEPSSRPSELTEKKLLLGEGEDEVRFFKALLRHLGVDAVQVEQYGGKSNLGNYLVTLPKRPGFASLSAIAITRDADTDPRAAYQSVSDSIARISLERPAAPATFSAGTPRIGIYIFPDCAKEGMLEDLCLASVSGDSATACVDDFANCLETAGCRPKNPSKSRLHAWLASRQEPDKRLGEAALKGYWPWDAAAFEPLKAFILDL